MILIIVWIAVIWGHSMQPATVSEGESGRFLEVINKIIPAITNDDNGMYIVRKAAHFTEYMILGILLSIRFSMEFKGIVQRLSNPALTGLAIAFIDETIQLFVEGRSGQISDMWIDFGGAILGILITLAIINNRGKGRYRGKY